MSTILIVDDEPSVRLLLRVYLQPQGYQVLEAEDGREALAILQNTPVDLVFCDLYLPGPIGTDTLPKLRKHDAKLQIVAMSGGSHVDGKAFVQVALQLGANSAIQKPFSLADIDQLINRYAPLPASA